MMVIIFYQKDLRQRSFLQGQIKIKNLFDLKIPTQSYRNLLEKTLFHLDAFHHVIFSPRPINSFAELGLILKEAIPSTLPKKDDYVVFYNINNFPLYQEEINSIINKMPYVPGISLCTIKNFLGQEEHTGIVGCDYQGLPQLFNLNEEGAPRAPQADTIIDVTPYLLQLDNSKHVLRLFSSNFQLRHFNSINEEGAYLIKRSTHKEKLEQEYLFLKNLPSVVKPYFPHVGEGKSLADAYQYQIEKVSSFDCSKLLINGFFSDPLDLLKFFQNLKNYFKILPRNEIPKSEYQYKIAQLIEKNQKRLMDLEKNPAFNLYNQYCEQLTNASLFSYGQQLNQLILNLSKKQSPTLFLSHGDLCLPNILYNTETETLKFIDPRGGDDYTYAPFVFDLAKLSHSFLGLYDFIVSDLFDIRMDKNLSPQLNFHIEIKERNNLKNYFEAFIDSLGVEIEFVRVIEASLFLSMMPLHKNSPQRMLAQLLNSISIFQQLPLTSRERSALCLSTM